MKREKALAAIEVIKKDATLQFNYCNDDNTCQCVIGGLGMSVGFDLTRILAVGLTSWAIKPSNNPNEGDFAVIKEMRDSICNHYGFTVDQLKELQDINDTSYSTDERRLLLIDRVMTYIED